MALVLADRVQETTTTTGTGTVTLAGAVSGYQSFAAIGNGNTTYYTITSGTDWEVGIGTYTSSGTTLARTTILSSSAAGAAITLAGTSTVFATYPAERAVAFDSAGNSNLLNVNNVSYNFATTATAAGTTTLTAASAYYQYFTGATTQTVVMPVTSTLALGWSYHICNNSTGNITVNSSGANLIGTILPGTTIHITCINTAVTTAAGWDFGYTDFGTATGTGSVALSASPTFTGTVNTSSITATGGTVLISGGTLSSSGSTLISLISTNSITIGSTSGVSSIVVGQSTAGQTVNLANGATNSGQTKTVNIGTAGASGSTTAITLGSATSGATTNIITYGNIGVGGANYGTSGQVLTSAGSGAAPSWATPTGVSQAKATALSMILGF